MSVSKTMNAADRFRTRIPISKCSEPISLGDTILALGSCFADAVGTKLRQFRFDAEVNPFGPLYNPLTIITAIERIAEGVPYFEQELFEHNELCHSYDHYSSFSRPSIPETLDSINTALLGARAQFEKADILLITFGTAWVYRLEQTGAVVANCHKLPSRLFTRELLSAQDIVTAYERFLSSTNIPTIIATVSPVRHLRDDPHENQIGKSILFAALHELESRHERLRYFPAYEIMMDELRDYRFYAEDMVHPARIAVEYIWQRFTEGFMSDRSRQFIEQYEEVLRARMHHLSLPGSRAAQQFGSRMCRKLESLQDEYPEVSLKDDKSYFRSIC